MNIRAHIAVFAASSGAAVCGHFPMITENKPDLSTEGKEIYPQTEKGEKGDEA